MSKNSTSRGISFPFRIGNKGGVVMSEVSNFSASHLDESIEQILLTLKGERVMEHHFGSELDTSIFEPSEVSTHNLIKYQINEALTKHEPRITVDMDSIQLSQEEGSDTIIVDITYVINEYNSTHRYSTRLGGEAVEN